MKAQRGIASVCLVSAFALVGCGGLSTSAESTALRTSDPAIKAKFIDCVKSIKGWAWQDTPPAPKYRDAVARELSFQDKVVVGKDVTERLGTLVWIADPSVWDTVYLAPDDAAAERAVSRLNVNGMFYSASSDTDMGGFVYPKFRSDAFLRASHIDEGPSAGQEAFELCMYSARGLSQRFPQDTSAQ